MRSAPRSRAILSVWNEMSAAQPMNGRSWYFLSGLRTCSWDGRAGAGENLPIKTKSESETVAIFNGKVHLWANR
jgi:hypothetical protein